MALEWNTGALQQDTAGQCICKGGHSGGSGKCSPRSAAPKSGALVLRNSYSNKETPRRSLHPIQATVMMETPGEPARGRTKVPEHGRNFGLGPCDSHSTHQD